MFCVWRKPKIKEMNINYLCQRNNKNESSRREGTLRNGSLLCDVTN